MTGHIFGKHHCGFPTPYHKYGYYQYAYVIYSDAIFIGNAAGKGSLWERFGLLD